MDGSPSRGKPFAFVPPCIRLGVPPVVEMRFSRSVETQAQLAGDEELVAYCQQVKPFLYVCSLADLT